MATVPLVEDEIAAPADAYLGGREEVSAESHDTRRTRRKAVIGASIVGVMVTLALLADVIASQSPTDQDLLNRLADPSWDHLLGTDALGRDVFSRVVHAAQTDLWVGFLAALIPLVIGTTLGAIAGYYGKLSDAAVMRSADLVQAFPIYVFMLALVGVLGQGVGSILIAFAVIGWVTYARLVHAEVLRVREMEYIAAARCSGLSRRRVLIRHVMPNSINQIVVYYPIDVIFAILTLAAFSYLGLGIPSPEPEWGSIIAEGQPYVTSNWWLVAVPGLCIVTLGIGLSFLSDAFDEWLQR